MRHRTPAPRRSVSSVLRAAAASTMLVALLGAAACNPDAPSRSNADGLTTIRVGYQAATDYGLFYLAQKKGWFRDAGINVELSLFDSGGEQVEALAGGSLDVTLQGAQPPILAAEQGTAPVRLIGPLADSAGLFSIVGSPGISKVSDLRGKKIAVTAGTAYEFYLDTVLRKYGMTGKDVKKVDLQPLDGQGAFLAGQVDAVVPIATSRYLILEKKPDAKLIFKHQDWGAKPNPTQFSVYDLMVTTKGVIKEKRDALRRMLNVVYTKMTSYVTGANAGKAVDDLTAWQSDVIKAPTTRKAVQQLVESYEFYDLARAKRAMGDDFEKQIESQAQFLVDTKKTSSVPDTATLVDESLINAL